MAAFTGLGVAEDEEKLYIWLLSHPDQDAAAAARALRLARRRCETLLASLLERGIVSRASASGSCRAVAPEVAVEHLILQQQEEMERARAAASRLAVEAHAALGGNDAAPIEVVRGPRARQRVFLDLQRAARHQVRILDRPPYAVAPRPPSNEIERQRLTEGIAYRVIYDPEGLPPSRVEALAPFLALGEQARILPELPIKMAIRDDDEALLVPLDETTDAMLVRAPVLLRAVTSLFEQLWARAMPLRASRASSADGRRPDAKDLQILSLLALGYKDEAVARDLGIARRTIERRVGALLRLTGGRNRFQLGLEAERRGWLSAQR